MEKKAQVSERAVLARLNRKLKADDTPCLTYFGFAASNAYLQNGLAFAFPMLTGALP